MKKQEKTMEEKIIKDIADTHCNNINESKACLEDDIKALLHSHDATLLAKIGNMAPGNNPEFKKLENNMDAKTKVYCVGSYHLACDDIKKLIEDV